MAQFTAQIQKVVVNGPYAYLLMRDRVGQKSAGGFPTVGAAMNAVRDDIGGLLGGETVERIVLQAETGP